MHFLYKTFILLTLIIIVNDLYLKAQPCSISAGNDTILCAVPTTLNLFAQTSSALDSCTALTWTPSAGLSNPNIPNPVASITSSITYTVTANIPFGPNLISNGDFESGNTGFNSLYTYNCPFGGILNEDQYCVTDDPHNVHTGATSCSDHTSGSGLMMVVNGAVSGNSTVWSENIAVNPNTYYLFSFWASNWSSTTSFLPTFDIKVNNVLQGLALTIYPTQCLWKKNCLLWYSGAATSVSFKIIDLESASFGNDFSLDDVSLQEVCQAMDSIQITVGGAVSQSSDTTVCEGSLLTLTASAGTGFSWTPSGGLSCDTCQSVSLIADSSITYIVSGTSSLCGYADTFKVNVDTLPYLSLPDDTSLCQGDQLHIVAQSSSLLSWSPASSLSCTLCNDPVASPTTTTTYTASISNGTCSSYDSITIKVNPLPLNSLIPDTDICLGSSVALTTDSSYTYTIDPDEQLNCNPCSIPIAAPDSMITYSVLISDSACSIKDTVTILVSYNDSVTASVDDSICKGESVQLSSEGASDYEWTPQSTLNNPQISDPVATPFETTQYIVEGKDACGTTADTVTILVSDKPTVTAVYDSIIYCNSGTEITLTGPVDYLYQWLNPDVEIPSASSIFVDPKTSTIYEVHISNQGCDTVLAFPIVLSNADGIAIPNAFSPNEDGKNDLFGILNYCPLHLDYFRIFNRWGQMIFQTTNINDAWNGNFENSACPLGVYVYAISFTEPDGNHFLLKGNVTLIR